VESLCFNRLFALYSLIGAFISLLLVVPQLLLLNRSSPRKTTRRGLMLRKKSRSLLEETRQNKLSSRMQRKED
jgi:hypothetical protein